MTNNNDWQAKQVNGMCFVARYCSYDTALLKLILIVEYFDLQEPEWQEEDADQNIYQGSNLLN